MSTTNPTTGYQPDIKFFLLYTGYNELSPLEFVFEGDQCQILHAFTTQKFSQYVLFVLFFVVFFFCDIDIVYTKTYRMTGRGGVWALNEWTLQARRDNLTIYDPST